MSFIIVATSEVGDTFYAMNAVNKNYSSKRLDAYMFDDIEDANTMKDRLELQWNNGGFVPFPINFWIDDTNNPRFDSIMSGLDEI